ncbi:MAG: dihydropteroate synthase [Planctomycetota bacterium]|jgi:5-methyltetrahydrofolate corrinoid/iron sulfur protein methyltransferase
MIIFSERINGMYRDVRGAINEKEKSVIQELTRQQVAGGADVMDVNLGPTKGDPVENFVWLAQTVQEVTDKPISLDSAKPKLLAEAVPKVKAALPDTKLVINSSKATPDDMGKLIPVAAENQASIIGLTMDQEGVPGNVEKRVECGATFLMTAMESGLGPEDVYIDTIILPVNVAPKQPGNVMEAIRQLAMVNDPPPHFILGLSNVSQKCLMNKMINRTYLVMCLAAGLDAAIMDAGDKELVEAAISAEVMLEKHLYSDDYIKAWRMQKGLDASG